MQPGLRKLSPLQILRASNISAWWKNKDTTPRLDSAEVLAIAMGHALDTRSKRHGGPHALREVAKARLLLNLERPSREAERAYLNLIANLQRRTAAWNRRCGNHGCWSAVRCDETLRPRNRHVP